MNIYQALAVAVLTVHLGWIVWVIFGWVVTPNRAILRWFHILSLIYSILIENLPWPCPLTIAETRCEELAGIQPYHEPFLIHNRKRSFIPMSRRGCWVGAPPPSAWPSLVSTE